MDVNYLYLMDSEDSREKAWVLLAYVLTILLILASFLFLGTSRSSESPDPVPEHEEAEEEAKEDPPGVVSSSRKSYLKQRKKEERASRTLLEIQRQKAKAEKAERALKAVKERQEEREEKEKEERERRIEAQKERNRRADEEFERWKGDFEVQDKGNLAVDSLDSGGSALEKFVGRIRQDKVVLVEELSVEFGISTQDCVERIQQLEEMGLIWGIMDEKGKYISISMDEKEQLVRLIREHGRVSLRQVAEWMNEIISAKNSSERKFDMELEELFDSEDV